MAQKFVKLNGKWSSTDHDQRGKYIFDKKCKRLTADSFAATPNQTNLGSQNISADFAEKIDIKNY